MKPADIDDDFASAPPFTDMNVSACTSPSILLSGLPVPVVDKSFLPCGELAEAVKKTLLQITVLQVASCPIILARSINFFPSTYSPCLHLFVFNSLNLGLLSCPI